MLEFYYIKRGLLHDRTRLTQVTGLILQVRNTGKIIKKTNRRSNNVLKNKLNASQRQEHPLVIIIGRVFKVT